MFLKRVLQLSLGITALFTANLSHAVDEDEDAYIYKYLISNGKYFATTPIRQFFAS